MSQQTRTVQLASNVGLKVCKTAPISVPTNLLGVVAKLQS